ncbi:hypothetical protein, partial [Pseudonocardia xinjiangensis]|uniref:hypothetical protein n=1 Tax=Pseudonocardia xinjiangensis TaxID=75289 RepID=UPI0031D519C0
VRLHPAGRPCRSITPRSGSRSVRWNPKSDLFNKATRWTHHDDSGFIPYAITTGLDYEAMTEQRKGYENFVYQNGVYDLGTKGDMRRNERNLMWNLDPYIQTHWQLT